MLKNISNLCKEKVADPVDNRLRSKKPSRNDACLSHSPALSTGFGREEQMCRSTQVYNITQEINHSLKHRNQSNNNLRGLRRDTLSIAYNTQNNMKIEDQSSNNLGWPVNSNSQMNNSAHMKSHRMHQKLFQVGSLITPQKQHDLNASQCLVEKNLTQAKLLREQRSNERDS